MDTQANRAGDPLISSPLARREGGFSLIEVSLVLVLVGILLVLAIPALSGYQASRNLDLGAQQFIGDVRAAVDRSRTQHFLFRITFTAGSGTYSIDQWKPTSGLVSDDCNMSLMSTGGGSWFTVEKDTLPSGVTVTSTPAVNPIVFSCLGTPYNSSGSVVTLTQSIAISNSAGTRSLTIGTDSNVQCSSCSY